MKTVEDVRFFQGACR